MALTMRHYDHSVDYERVGRFLERTYRTSGGHVNWVQPRWEYMHYHPYIRNVELEAIGVWEADGAAALWERGWLVWGRVCPSIWRLVSGRSTTARRGSEPGERDPPRVR